MHIPIFGTSLYSYTNCCPETALALRTLPSVYKHMNWAACLSQTKRPKTAKWCTWTYRPDATPQKEPSHITTLPQDIGGPIPKHLPVFSMCTRA